MSFWPPAASAARRQAVDTILLHDGGNTVRQAANQSFADGLQLADTLQSFETLTPLVTVFPSTSIGNQLKEVARLIRIRSQMGPGRQVFFCSMDGYDTHSSQDWTHWNLLSQLSQALNAFDSATLEIGVSNQVTAFTQSEFNRTMQSNGSGSDHAWGSHQMVLGGAVRGGIYGQVPTFALGGPRRRQQPRRVDSDDLDRAVRRDARQMVRRDRRPTCPGRSRTWGISPRADLGFMA